MAKQDWDRARWAWILALIGGVSYFYAVIQDYDGLFISLWKTSGVAFLALWAALNARNSEYYWISAVMAFGAAGDFLLAEFGLPVGGAAFAIGHFIAISFYLRHRRRKFSFSQKLFAYVTPPLAMIIVWQLAKGQPPQLLGSAVGYTGIVAVMMACAWTSRFPRYVTGLGAFSFLISDLFIFAGEGGALPKDVTSLLIWPLYFGGQVLIIWGVIATLAQTKVDKIR